MSIESALNILQLDNKGLSKIDQNIVKKQYRKLVKEYHPDKTTVEDLKKEYEEKTKLINLAYEFISNELKNNIVIDNIDLNMELSKKVFEFIEYAHSYKKCSVNEIIQGVSKIIDKLDLVSISSQEELEQKKMLFDAKIFDLFVNYENKFRIINNIPFEFCEDEVDYKNGTIKFLSSLDYINLKRHKYIYEKLSSVSNRYDIADDIIDTKYFEGLIFNVYERLLNSKNDNLKEQKALVDFNDMLSSFYNKYLSVIRKVNKVFEYIDSLNYTFKKRYPEYENYKNDIVKSIFDDNFNEVYIEILQKIKEHRQREKEMFNIDQKLRLKRQNTIYDKNTSNDIYLKIAEISSGFINGEYDYKQIKLLNEISFSNLVKDEFILSCFCDKNYEVYVSIENADKSNIRFLLKDVDNNGFIHIIGDDILSINADELYLYNEVITLDEFIDKSKIINYEYDKKGKKTSVLCKYNNYYLVRTKLNDEIKYSGIDLKENPLYENNEDALSVKSMICYDLIRRFRRKGARRILSCY